MRRSKFSEAVFLWRLTRARFSETSGNFSEARRRLGSATAPEHYVALRDAYDARLASIAYAGNVTFEGLAMHPPDEMLRLISELQTRRWYWAPKTDNDRYAARYLDYLEAAILGEGEKRSDLAKKLQLADANTFFKKVLLVT